jgi:hypothetical protein
VKNGPRFKIVDLNGLVYRTFKMMELDNWTADCKLIQLAISIGSFNGAEAMENAYATLINYYKKILL